MENNAPESGDEIIKILVVDDSPSDRTIFRRFLSQNADQKYSFTETETAGEGFTKIEANEPNCVLLDYDLPDVKGTDLIRQINEKYGRNHIPVVMLSGSGNIEIAVEAMTEGAQDFLVKSRATPADLMRAVSNAIEKVRLFKEKEVAAEKVRISEERYRLLFENTPLPAIVFDRESLAILAANDYAIMHYGYTRDEFLRMTLKELDAFDGASLEIVLGEFGGDADALKNIPAQHRKKNNSIIDVEVNLHDITFQNRDARFLIAQDITERKMIEREREVNLIREKELREEAESANRAKDEFLAVLSHELRTPLNAMYGWARMLIQGGMEETRVRKAVEVIERNIRLQNNLIDDLLDVSRIISGKIKLEPTNLDICQLLKEIVEAARFTAEDKKIQINQHFDSVECIVYVDPFRIQQIINNLLTNAIKFTPEGGKIDVSLEIGNEKVKISVRDTGIGIEPNLLPHIFERFKQADGSTKRKFGGLGLGLTIARSLTEMHSGTITATSSGENRGATFTVELPIVQAAKQNGGDSNNGYSRNPRNSAEPLEGLKIVAVDDDRDSLELLKFVLQSKGAEFYGFAGATAALEKIENIAPDVLISDISMAEMDGFDLIQKVRELPSAKDKFLPAIAMTAYTGSEDRAALLSAGFQLHVAKPIDVEHIAEKILELLDRFRK